MSEPLSDRSAPSPAPDPVAQRVTVSLDNWKRKLLDLSRRNRALNFRVNKVSTVTIVDEQPAEVFKQLYLLEKAMRFLPAPEKKGASEAPKAAAGEPVPVLDQIDEIDEEAAGPAVDFTPYDASQLKDRHRDDLLQTASSPEQLDKSLRRIEEQARTAIEEQGVNPLFLALGMLHYRQEKEDQEMLRAPLVLLPVALSRRSAQAGYVLKAADEDPMVNPALAESLRRFHGLKLPELPELTDIPADYDLQGFLRAVTEAVAPQAGWAVKTEIYLGLFSFQKFVMYKDLEANAPAFGAHRLIRRLVARDGSQMAGLPEEVRALDLDACYPPEASAQVVDADASQLRAIAAVHREHDMVLEGPPGTGKSQTITNLIAQALAAGRSVLFVAEKMAALQVVHTRLTNAGLGEFCLELHSARANKRLVMKELGAALDASLQRPALPESDAGRLKAVREELNAYVQAVHAPWGALGLPPFRAYGELGGLLDAPRVRYTGAVQDVTRERLDAAVRDLEALAGLGREVGDPAVHPWRDSTRTFYSADDLETIGDLLRDAGGKLEALTGRAAEAAAALALPQVGTFAEAETAVAIGAVLGRSPGAPLDVLQSEAWSSPPAEALDIVERGKKVRQLREHAEARLTDEALERDHAVHSEDAEFIERKAASLWRFLSFLSGRHREIKARWTRYRRPGYQPASLAEQAADMRQADALRRERQTLAGQDAAARRLFGGLWQGERSSWDDLDAYIRWVVEVRALCVRHGLEGSTVEMASRARPDVSPAVALREAAADAARLLAGLRERVGWPADYLAAAPFAEILDRVRALADGLHLAPRWAAFEEVRARTAAGLAAEALAAGMKAEVPFAELPRAFLRGFYQRWVTTVVQEREALRGFHALTHEQRVEEFRQLDRRVLEQNRVQLVRQLRDRTQKRLQTPEATAGMPFLRREMARQRALSPLRRTMRNAEAAVRAIKPCFLMSPLTVAQLLEGAAPSFDLVVFDEASQLPPEDAVGAIARGRQLVVVGDPKQLPPTNFFAVMAGQETAPTGEDGLPLYEDGESILEEFLGAGVPSTRLRWHYRSTHESLITFSNISFYDAGLHTFPSVETDSHAQGLRFEHVADGVYEGKGVNPIEARRVVEEILRHARETPELTLGVGTFNLRQQLEIQDELERRRRQDPTLEPFFAPREEGPFFVKNLENIQGDERDVILLSVTYGRGPDGKIRYNFGPLNGENGWRRLNVLTTRAKKRMKVFSSMRGEDINVAQSTAKGARLLRDFLLYAEHGRLEGAAPAAAGEAQRRAFERDIEAELTRNGLRLQPRVGVAGYRIDFGVLDETVPGRFLCGIECDGPTYGASETARDRDRLRREVLAARGWTLLRVWSTDWFKDRAGQVERLLRQIEELRRRAREEAAAEAEARRAEETARAAEAASAPPEPAAPAPAVEPSGPAAAPYRTPARKQYERADEIPPEEYREAVLAVLRPGVSLDRKALTNEVRALFGFNRTGPRLQEAIGAAIDGLLRDEVVGEGSAGIRLRG